MKVNAQSEPWKELIVIGNRVLKWDSAGSVEAQPWFWRCDDLPLVEEGIERTAYIFVANR